MERELRRLVTIGSGGVDVWPCVPMYSDRVPHTSYATLVLIHATQWGRPIRRVEKGDGGERFFRMIAAQDSTYSVQWYGAGAIDTAERFRMWLESVDGHQELHRTLISYRGSGSVTNLSALISDQWESRSELEINVGYTLRQSDEQRSMRYKVESVEFSALLDVAGEIVEKPDPTLAERDQPGPVEAPREEGRDFDESFGDEFQ